MEFGFDFLVFVCEFLVLFLQIFVVEQNGVDFLEGFGIVSFKLVIFFGQVFVIFDNAIVLY